MHVYWNKDSSPIKWPDGALTVAQLNRSCKRHYCFYSKTLNSTSLQRSGNVTQCRHLKWSFWMILQSLTSVEIFFSHANVVGLFVHFVKEWSISTTIELIAKNFSFPEKDCGDPWLFSTTSRLTFSDLKKYLNKSQLGCHDSCRSSLANVLLSVLTPGGPLTFNLSNPKPIPYNTFIDKKHAKVLTLPSAFAN